MLNEFNYAQMEWRRNERLKKRNALLTRYDLAERLDVSPDTILKWVRQGKIPVIRISRKVLRFDYDGIVAALRKKAASESHRLAAPLPGMHDKA